MMFIWWLYNWIVIYLVMWCSIMVCITVYSMVHYGINACIRIPTECNVRKAARTSLWNLLYFALPESCEEFSQKWNMHMNLPDLVHEEHQRAPFLWRDSVRNSSLCNLRVSSKFMGLQRLWIPPPPRFHPVQPFGYQSHSRCNLVVHPQGFNQFCPKILKKLGGFSGFSSGVLTFLLRFPHHHCDIIAVFPTIHLNQLLAASIARETWISSQSAAG